MKVCFKCHEEKPLSGFYTHGGMSDKQPNKCKECTKSDVRKNYSKNRDKYREYEKDRAKHHHRIKARADYLESDRGKIVSRRCKKDWADRNPEKKKANTAVGTAVRYGLLKKQPCEKCGHGRAQAHHDDYSKALDVRWLCAKCHSGYHRKLREEAC